MYNLPLAYNLYNAARARMDSTRPDISENCSEKRNLFYQRSNPCRCILFLL